MAYSNNIGVKTFNSLKVVDHAFRRCRLPAQAITSEMQDYALDSLAFMLDDLSTVVQVTHDQHFDQIYDNGESVMNHR